MNVNPLYRLKLHRVHLGARQADDGTHYLATALRHHDPETERIPVFIDHEPGSIGRVAYLAVVDGWAEAVIEVDRRLIDLLPPNLLRIGTGVSTGMDWEDGDAETFGGTLYVSKATLHEVSLITSGTPSAEGARLDSVVRSLERCRALEMQDESRAAEHRQAAASQGILVREPPIDFAGHTWEPDIIERSQLIPIAGHTWL